MMEMLKVGTPYNRVSNRGEGVFFDIRYPTIELIYNMKKPTEREIEQVQSNKPFEIRVCEIEDVIIVTSKLGSLQWMDAPYNPNLGDCRLDELESDTQGYGLYFLLTDSPSGIIKHIRMVGLSNNFSHEFRSLAMENKQKNISVETHDTKIRNVFLRYTSEELANRSTIRCKIKAET